ncbi:SDR family NAD(P)-dependent oxidoreductase [Streptomyces sp. NPDC001404]|uniref:SDR family NAD(P)-dependent oxidoreductase n=1 Tax=Streptomyces sp. NPDC001404 TaxID=3364571 RepID=UPI0036CB6C14
MTDVVLVTGGASGIGAAVARRFARDGARVVIADLDEAGGAALAEETGGVFVRTDVTREEDNRAAVEAAVTAFGGLDVVYLNAGAGGGGGVGADFDLERYRRVLAVIVDGTMFGMNAALPVLASAGGGAIVVTSSLAGVAPAPLDPVYSAAKHAVTALARSLAPAWAESGVTINAVCPGFVDTPMIAQVHSRIVEFGLAVADPAEVAEAVVSIVAGGGTGEAWLVQAGQTPVPAEFLRVEPGRTGPGTGG